MAAIFAAKASLVESPDRACRRPGGSAAACGTFAPRPGAGGTILAGRPHPGAAPPQNSPLSLLVSAGLDRAPCARPHPAAIALLKETGRPVRGRPPTIGQVTATIAPHVAESLGGKLDFILDAGSATLGIEPP